MGTVVFTFDVSKQFNSKYKSKIFVKAEKALLRLTIDDKVMDELEKSKDRDLAAAKIVEKAQKLCKQVTDDLAVQMSNLDKILPRLPDEQAREKAVKDYRAVVEKQLDDLAEKLKELPEEQWKKFLAKYAEAKKEYKSYKVNAVVDVTVGTLGVVGSGIALAGTVHTGGASLVLGVIGMTRSVAQIAQVVYSIAVDVETQSNALKDDVESLLKQFTESKGKAIGKDLAKTTVNAVFGAPFFTTASTASSKAETLGGKVSGTYVGGVKLSRKVTESLNAMKKLEGDLAKLKGKDLKKAEEKLTTLQGKFSKLFDNAADMNAKAKRVEKDLKTIKKVLEELKKETTTLAYVEKALTVLTNLALAGASAGVSISGDAGNALALANDGLSLGNSVLSEVKDALG